MEGFYSALGRQGKGEQTAVHSVLSTRVICSLLHVFSLRRDPLVLLRTGPLTLASLPLTSCVSLGESLNLSGSLFPLLFV